MKSVVTVLILLTSLLAAKKSYSQNRKEWNADWIAAPNDPGNHYGVYYFRKTINLPAKPASFIVHVSADNRYKLYVNGTLVSLGPTRGDYYFWNYETVDLASWLVAGKNTIAALVWNEAEFRPEAQISFRTGFILQGHSPAEEILNTNTSWKCIRDAGHQPVPGYFFAAGKGEMVDMNQAVKGDWTADGYDDSNWPPAAKVSDGRLKGMAWGTDWSLVPSPLPPREMTYQRIPVLRMATGMSVPPGFPKEKTSLTIPANTTVALLLDQTYETNGYITLNFSGGKDAGISLGYAESLYEKGSKGTAKGNRNEVEGKEFIGRKDSLIADGSKDQSYTTLNFRTFRYIRLFVQTKNDPLVIDDLYGTFTGYPFKRASVFNTADTEINKMLDIGWRTARLNAWETYTDCPYYEQLQYIGDTRIQAMVSYYNTSDDRLARNALNEIDDSRLPEGVTRSCYPTKGTQVISTFSLWYICMLHDYWMYRGDDGFIKNKLPGERGVLDFFSKYQLPDGSIKDMPYWAFVDWVGNMGGGPKGSDGCAAIYDLQLLWAYQWAAEMEARIGLHDYAVIYAQKAAQLKATIRRKYWDPVKKLYADTKEKTGFSQHVNSLAILTGMVSDADMAAVANALLNDKNLTQCTIYFKYYLNQALVKAGLGDHYMDWLDIYRENMAMGLTTWAEVSDVNTTRSDCHAWGSSPNIEFFRTVLGIDSYAPGFSQIKIEPHLGSITHVSGEIPHPNGKVAVAYALEKDKWNIKISLPSHTSGKFIWKNKTYLLKAGENEWVIPAEEKNAPFSLRVDLLRHPDQCRVNSRFPAFSWIVSHQYQSAYQILVASQYAADLWNSGKKNSTDNIGKIYNGPALKPSTTYYWKVRTWYKNGKVSPYSAIQTFVTGEKLEDFALPPVTLVKTLQQPQKVTSSLYDFGRDGFSQIRLSVSSRNPNDTLIIHLGEALTPDGHINKTPPGSVRYRMIKVPLTQGQQCYVPAIAPDKRNTAKNAILMPADIGEVLPFRYAEIDDAPTRYHIDSVSRYLVTSAFDDDATTFISSDTVLNKIWDLCKYTIKATSFSGYYVDGDRERIPYEADALITQLSHYASDAEFTMAERTLDYLVYHPTWPTEWSLQNILIAWNDYLYSGDQRLAAKLYPQLKAKILTALARQDGLISTRTGRQTPDFLQSIHFTQFNEDSKLKDIVDWPQPGETDGFVFTDYNAVVNAFYYADLQVMAKLAMALGNVADANYYSQEAIRVRAAFRHAFFDPQTNLVLDGEGAGHSSLHANFFALAFGLVPREKVVGVVSFIHSRGMACSVYGAQFLLDALSRVNDQEYAVRLLTSTEKRSWYNMLREGASMTMEAWGQEYKPNQDWCHAWGTAPANYIIRHLAGIQPLTPGYGEVEIKPQPGSVEHATLTYQTIRGDIEESFENKRDSFRLNITLPGNTIGRVYLPCRSGKAAIKMDGHVVKSSYSEGYRQIRNVTPGKHYFEASPCSSI
jgi:alpha-L-rhamnosidase